MILEEVPGTNEGFVLCLECKQPICIKCKEKAHKSKRCIKSFADVITALKNERIRCCPNCLEIYIKDNKCEHVTCSNCKLEFCFACSAPRMPIMRHGNHYHRKDCKLYQPWIDPKSKKEVKD